MIKLYKLMLSEFPHYEIIENEDFIMNERFRKGKSNTPNRTFIGELIHVDSEILVLKNCIINFDIREKETKFYTKRVLDRVHPISPRNYFKAQKNFDEMRSI